MPMISKDRNAVAKPIVQLPCCFVPNRGQIQNPRIRYTAKGAGFEASFTSNEAIFTIYEGYSNIAAPASSTIELDNPIREIRSTRLDFRFIGANSGVEPEGQQLAEGKVHYIKSIDPAQWQTDIPMFHRIVYRELWPGIDLVFRSEGRSIKYEFVVQPGTDPTAIRFSYTGAQQLRLDDEGNLAVHTPLGALIDPRPICYQDIDGHRFDVPGSFTLEWDEQQECTIGFRLGEPYDRSASLVIDPGLIYSTYLGGSGNDEPFGIAVDSAGSAYVTGITTSTNFPVTPGVIQTTLVGDRDMFITKLNATGTALVYSTYVGGTAYDVGQNVAVDAAGNAYVTGRTYSADFPVTPDAVQTTFGGLSDAFVLKLNPTGSELLYSTYLGGVGHDYGLGIAIDSSGDAYVTGFTASANMPVTPGAFQTVYGGANDGFISKLNPTGTALVYSTFLGGSGGDNGTAIAVDTAGNAYVTGNTASLNFPTTAGAFQTARRGTGDTFVTKLNAAGSALIYSTYLGGNGVEYGYGISVDSAGNAYTAGYTRSADFPVTAGAFQTVLGGTANVFVTKMNSSGNGLIYSTYIGRSNFQLAYGSGLDTGGNVFVAGYTLATDYPTTPDAIQTTLSGTRDAIATKIDASGSSLIFSSYLGGSGVDSGSAIAGDILGNMYVTGYTFSTDFPVTTGAFQTAIGGLVDVFVTKFGLVPDLTVTKSADRTDVLPGKIVTYFITVNNTGETELTNIQVGDAQIGLSEAIASLDPGQSQTFTQTFTVPAITVPGTFTNTVTVTANELANSKTATAVINVGAAPSLLFTKTVSPASAAPGATVMFTIVAANAGNVAFTDVVLNDPLLGLIESIDQIGVGTQATFNVPFIIPGDAPSGSTIVNTADIQGSNLPLKQAAAAVIVTSAPRLELTKAADPLTVVPGNTVNFSIRVRNTGNVILTNIVLTDEIAGLNEMVISLAVGETAQFQAPFLVPLETPPGSYTNTVEAVSDQTARVTATATITVLASPLIGVSKVPDTDTAAPGQNVQYAVGIANPGNVPLTGIRILDPLLGADMPVPDLAVGDIRQLTLPFTVPAATPIGSSIANLLTVTTNEAEPVEVLSVIQVVGQGLSLSKTVDTAAAAPGTVVNYTLTVTNLLNATQTNVTISDPQLGINETIASLPASGVIVRSAPFAVPVDVSSGTVITNTFEAASDQTPLQRTSASFVVQTMPDALTTVTIRKLPDQDAVAPGETVIFTVQVTNTGSNAATSIIVSDSLLGTQATIPVLLPGQTTYVQFPFTVPDDIVQGTIITNRATAVWTEQPAGSTAQSETQIVASQRRFLLGLTNVPVPTAAPPGSTVLFIVTVRNLSALTLTSIRVIEPLTGFSTLIPSLLPGESRIFQQPFTIPPNARGDEIFTSPAFAFSDQTPLQQVPASVTTAVLPNAILTETVDRPEGRPGETVFFTIRVRNTGNVVLVNGVLTAPLFNLTIRESSFEIGADISLRIPFVLPEVIEDTTIVSPVSIVWSNGPRLEASASVRVIVDEE